MLKSTSTHSYISKIVQVSISIAGGGFCYAFKIYMSFHICTIVSSEFTTSNDFV